MKKKYAFVLLSMAFAISGCGVVDNALRSDNNIKEKAAFALGTTPDKITITNRTSDINSVKFNATTNGKVYQCYYSTAGVSSDALCSSTDGSSLPNGSQCNALLKAANKC
ncbi:hypothetical protein BSK71_11190 [Pectobacterium actinidiae]|uniref:Lipoprotein n=1 Tax=Pectobacterium actinidiae TaxID=1507808 RepID=A0A1V2R370_9GAMM|nr:hypothetical protein [Pectobacterium actinidiae]QDX97376.1 hypothetical protein EGD00_10250 [Pectobacterium carotovorum subsp. carotovorum]MDY4313544.1 hypothetical protein [Pectobacterium actinidiae]ONK03955.1 hypothetical protein BSK69_11095 [Pectobacterium actinidiae]ONK05937.1 hypothetical protein BSK71_11190 [Pectobacterium actinidiae]WEF10286.1 hypothetical protein M9782_13775 [Pectobacterium actinidiae]